MANSVLSEFSDFFDTAKSEITKNAPDLTSAFVQPNMNNIVDENTKLKNEVERLKKRNSELNFELVELRMFKLMQEKKLMEEKMEQNNNNDGFHCR